MLVERKRESTGADPKGGKEREAVDRVEQVGRPGLEVAGCAAKLWKVFLRGVEKAGDVGQA